MTSRRWAILLAAIGGGLIYYGAQRGLARRLITDLHGFSGPGAQFYDRFTGRFLGRFYAGVAAALAARCPAGKALDVGSGTGNLAVALAQVAPGLQITGIDVSPDMVEHAARRAVAAGVSNRVRFVVADVGALPFADGQFDLVASTLSLHHWPDAPRGLAETRRVARLTGEVCIYDLAAWLLRATHHGQGLDELLAGNGSAASDSVEMKGWPAAVPLLQRACLRRAQSGEPSG